jgi:hypothetical protein
VFDLYSMCYVLNWLEERIECDYNNFLVVFAGHGDACLNLCLGITNRRSE